MPTYGDELMRSARTLARLQTQRRKLRRQLKAIERDIKVERKNLKALANRNTDPDIVPSRVFGVGVGHKWHQKHLASCQNIDGRWFCAADCPHHVVVDVEAEAAGDKGGRR